MPNAISNFFMKTFVNSSLHPLLGNRFLLASPAPSGGEGAPPPTTHA